MAEIENTKGDLSARREAQPLTWTASTTEPTEDQQKAILQACRIFGDLAARPWTPPEADRGGVHLFLPPIDKERLNHAVLIDGSRGSGKTAVLLTLLDAWSRRVRRESEPKETANTKSTTEDGRRQGEFVELLSRRAPIVPVGLIDLQPLPPSTSLLLYIVGQLHRVVEAIEHHGDKDRRGREQARVPWHATGDEEHASLKHWREFVEAAALGWNGDLQQRRAKLDPQAYVLEIQQVERRRLDVVTTFRRFVDALVRDYAEFERLSKEEWPLFVVAIDDADMNPERAPELLDLIRTLWHPRFAFVLTGDSALFRTTLQAKLFKVSLLESKAAVSNADDHLARLADDIYDKVIPPGHRCHIPSLSLNERFSRLRATLAKIPAFEHPLRFRSLDEYFELQQQARRVLPRRLRNILDFQQRIGVRRDGLESQQHAGATVLWELCRESGAKLPSDDYDGQTVQEIFEAYARAADALKATAHTRVIRLFEEAGKAIDIYDEFRLVTRKGNAASPKDLDSVYVVALDLTKQPLPSDLWLHSSLVRVVPSGLGWPLPAWSRALDYAAFAWCWRAVVARHREGKLDDQARTRWKSVGELARSYLATVIDYIHFRRARAKLSSSGSPPPILDELGKLIANMSQNPSWDELAEQLAKTVSEKKPESEESRWAHGQAGLLAAPEMGLDLPDANAWFKAFKSKFASNWKTVVAPELRAQRTLVTRMDRREWAEDLLIDEQGIADSALNEIDEGSAGYDFSTEMRADTEEVDNELARVFRSFTGTKVAPHAKDSTQLSTYLLPDRHALLIQTASAGLKKIWVEALDKLERDRGAVPIALTILWNEAVQRGEATALPRVEGQMNLPFLKSVYQGALAGGRAWNYQDQDQSWDIGQSLRIKEAKFKWREETGFRDSLSGALFELVWDATCDAADRTDEALMLYSDWWDAAGGRRDQRRGVYPWPTPSWPSFMDSEFLAIAWNDGLKKARHVDDTLPGAVQVADDLAFYYLGSMDDIAENRALETPWRNNVSNEMWRDFIHEKKDHLKSHKGARWSAYRAWFLRMPLMAAPESGLSATAAESILVAFEPNEEEKKLLRSARRNRLRDLKMGPSQIESEIERIDARNTDHPWIRIIEQPDRGSTQ